jgi:hypothetical protein
MTRAWIFVGGPWYATGGNAERPITGYVCMSTWERRVWYNGLCDTEVMGSRFVRCEVWVLGGRRIAVRMCRSNGTQKIYATGWEV